VLFALQTHEMAHLEPDDPQELLKYLRAPHESDCQPLVTALSQILGIELTMIKLSFTSPKPELSMRGLNLHHTNRWVYEDRSVDYNVLGGVGQSLPLLL
jgi:hypothetical protein